MNLKILSILLLTVTSGFSQSTGSIQSQLTALQTQVKSLQAQLAATQRQLTLVASNPALQLGPFVSVDVNPEVGVTGPNVVFKGANVHIISGSGQTGDYTGLGNLIIGYNESPGTMQYGDRMGSHNLVLGTGNLFMQWTYGGIAQGNNNTIYGPNSVCIGGGGNSAIGLYSLVIGGSSNQALGTGSIVIGGFNGTESAGSYGLLIGGCVNTDATQYGPTIGKNNGTTIGLTGVQ